MVLVTKALKNGRNDYKWELGRSVTEKHTRREADA